jgi:Protein of unknown function (DUF1615)
MGAQEVRVTLPRADGMVVTSHLDGLTVRRRIASRPRNAQAARRRVPRISLHSPKITRELTTQWLAGRVDSRYQDCLRRVAI